MAVKAMFGDKGGPSATERSSSPSLSYDSGSGDEEGQRLGIGVKTHSQRVSPGVTVNYPIQFQVRSLAFFRKNKKQERLVLIYCINFQFLEVLRGTFICLKLCSDTFLANYRERNCIKLSFQVINDRAEHIYGIPKDSEMFYNPTGREQDIQPMGRMFGTVVYNYESKPEFSFYSKHGEDPLNPMNTEAGKKLSQKEPIPRNIAPDSLLFESRFECGNLMRAVRITDTYYELHMRTDLYTDRHCGWFYFRVQNMRPEVEYRFSLVNFGKPDSQYGSGMKPVMYSEKEAADKGVGWQRAGHGMRYYKREADPMMEEMTKKKSSVGEDDEEGEEGGRYVMSFLISFPHADDTVYLAHCYPYRYSDMMLDLERIMADPERAQYIKRESLCQTLAGNDVPILTITSSDPVYDIRNKKFVIVTSRVHPGETPSSFIMKGILHYITGKKN